MNIAEILTHEAGIIERLVDTTDPDMVEAVEQLFAEVRRARAIEDQALRLVGEFDIRGMDSARIYMWPLSKAVAYNPRPDDAERGTAGDNEWWCPECNRVVDPIEVTFSEHHEACGTRVQ